MSVEQYCGVCRFYVNYGDHGNCKRYAPRRSREKHPEYGIWPWVDFGNWCGDFERKPITSATP